MIAVKVFLTCLVVFAICSVITRRPVEDRPWVIIPGLLSVAGMVVSLIAGIWML